MTYFYPFEDIYRKGDNYTQIVRDNDAAGNEVHGRSILDFWSRHDLLRICDIDKVCREP